jgi:hypothetical protein
MPIAGPALAGLIQAEMASAGFTGQNDASLAQAVGNGVILTILQSATYTGTSTGLGIGVGSSTGTLSGSITQGSAVGNLIFAQMSGMSLLGQKAQALASAIGNAVATHMSTAMVVGSSTVVGIGSGTGTIVGVLGPTMGANIIVQMQAMSILGQNSTQLAQAIGMGIASAIQASTATTTILGSAVGTVPPALPPIPSTGIDSGKLV